jgi:hypothetical protein
MRTEESRSAEMRVTKRRKENRGEERDEEKPKEKIRVLLLLQVFNIGYVMLNIDKQNITEEFIELGWNDGKEVKHSQPKTL